MKIGRHVQLLAPIFSQRLLVEFFSAGRSRVLLLLSLSVNDVIAHNKSATMETLNGTSWDVVIAGTGLPQSLLALYVCPGGCYPGSGSG